jgi:hypothetical protein
MIRHVDKQTNLCVCNNGHQVVTLSSISLTGANPSLVSYNASVVNFYNATGSLARLENKKHSTLENTLADYNAGVSPTKR